MIRFPAHWPDTDNAVYEDADEIVTELILKSGHKPDSLDLTGNPVMNVLYTQLMDVMFRSDRMNTMLANYARKTNEAFVELHAFNLFTGAAIRLPEIDLRGTWIVMKFTDMIEYSSSLESVTVTCRKLDDANDIVQTFEFHYCDIVRLVGNVRNPLDFEDDNYA